MGLVIDKLTGQIYLFDFPSSTGGTGSGGTAAYPQVNVYSQLPSAGSHNNQIYVVLQPSGTYVANRKEAGLYYSNGSTWTRLGDIPSFFSSGNFEVYDSSDNTKGVKFITSGLTTNTIRKITMRDSNGTLAYLQDLTNLTGITTIGAVTYVANTNNQTASDPGSGKLKWNNLVQSASTYIYIDNITDDNVDINKLLQRVSIGSILYIQKQSDSEINQAWTVTGITNNSGWWTIGVSLLHSLGSLSNNNKIEVLLQVVGASTSSAFGSIQVIDLVGGINVNTVLPTTIQWTNVEFSGTSLNYTGASRIYIQATGNYEISYNLVLKNGDSFSKSIGSVIRMNGTTNVTPLSVATYIDNGSSITGSNNIANYKRTFNAGDYIELQAFRISNSGSVTTIPGASWIRIIKT
jgi:hypothetical protein